MFVTSLRVFLYALVAATSPLALGATLAVLKSERPRINGIAFASGFLAGQTAICVIAFLLGDSSWSGPKEDHEVFGAILALVIGIALLVTAARVRALPPEPRPHRELGPRTKAMLTRLSRLTPGAALASGIALGIGGPKRFGLTLIVAATISAAGLGRTADISLVVFYLAVATLLVWLPVALYVVFGTRATDAIAHAQGWVTEHQRPLMLYPSLVAGIVLTTDAVARLLF